MRFRKIESIVGKVPFISSQNARYLTDLILKEKPRNILELGIAHGTATCYMAAALQELGRGSITAVDLIEVQFQPTAEEQLQRAGLADLVQVVRMQTGYTWFLHDQIVRNTQNDRCNEVYDLCVIDGSKNWTIDGAAFFFVDKLLKKNSWIIFDDYDWTYEQADTKRNSTDGISHRLLSKDERETPQIKEVFNLLVKQHPSYSNLKLLNGRWAVAQKTESNVKTFETIYRHEETYKDVQAWLIQKARRAVNRLKKI